MRDEESAFLRDSIEEQGAIEVGSVVLTASPSLLEDGEDLVVSWSGVKRPHATDFVGLSCGPQAHDADFLAKARATVDNSIGVDGQKLSNAVRFSSLYMMRCNYTVDYFNFQPQGNVYARLAKLQVGMAEAFTAPKQGHIAFTENEDEMSVMFNSASQEIPVVKYGLDASALDQQAEGKSKTYTAAHLCSYPANHSSQQWFRDPGYMHRVVLKGLNLGTRYFYKFGSDKDGWSSVYSFMSRPDASVKSAKFIAYADMGVDSAPAAISTAVRSYQDVVGGGYDSFLLHFGDISYARGHAHIWDEFFHVIEPHATRVPYMVSIGNHEYDYMTGGANDPSGATGIDGRMGFHPDWANYGDDSSGECSVPMFYRWDAPANGNSIYWYSFDYGGIHVVQVSSEHDWRRGSKQYKWLEKDLESVDRTKTPWVVLTSHRMMYTTQLGEEADYKVAQHFRDEVEGLLWDHKVNLMLVGHQHSYERSCAVRNGKCTKDGQGPVHIVIGSAGAGLEQQGFSNKLGDWSVSHVNDWGYLRVDSTEESMRVQFVLNRNGVVYDEVKLTPWK
uniref:Purple acid phosphatase n=1 Tax=Hyaloperonospora arabidopsidis (strain Emoy2) TaxID=559515 RepID=M4B968_HYAAE